MNIRKNNLIIFDNKSALYCFDGIKDEELKTIDLVKITTGAILEDDININIINDLIKHLKNFGIKLYLGGGITDKFIEKGKLNEFIEQTLDLGINIVELSSLELININILDISIEQLKKRGFEKILFEIGSKSLESDFNSDSNLWLQYIDFAIQKKVDSIILEGGIGDVGIYNNYYYAKTLLLIYLVKKIKEKGFNGELILETYQKESQKYIIELFGPDVKLGNIGGTELEYVNNLRNEEYNNELLNELGKFVDFIIDICNKNNINPDYYFFNEQFLHIDNISDINFLKQKIEEEVKLIKNMSKIKKGEIITLSDPILYLKELGINL